MTIAEVALQRTGKVTSVHLAIQYLQSNRDMVLLEYIHQARQQCRKLYQTMLCQQLNTCTILIHDIFVLAHPNLPMKQKKIKQKEIEFSKKAVELFTIHT